jgi:AcrR family transcriptional regulator
MDQRRAGRPSTAVLDRSRIGDAALVLVDESGDFTLPELARRLGVQTSSLYHHVDGRAGVVELLRERIGQEIDDSQLDRRPWDAALTGFCRSYRAAFAAHPRVVPLLTTATIRSPEVLVAYDKMIVLLEEMGVRPQQAMAFLTACENFIIGCALDLAAPDVMWEIPEGADVPHLAEALAVQESPEHRADNAFEYGLATLLGTLRTTVGSGVVDPAGVGR